MKINLAIDCTESTFSDTLTSLHSFITKNPWFNGKVYVITPSLPSLSRKTQYDLTTMYEDLEIIDLSLDPIFADLIREIAANHAALKRMIAVRSLMIKEEKLLFISSNCLFLKNIGSILLENSVVSCVNISGELEMGVFYRGVQVSLELPSYQEFKNLIMGGETIIKMVSSKTVVRTSQVLGERSSNFNDKVFAKKKSYLPSLHFMVYDTLKKDIRTSGKINQIWLQQKNIVSNLLKKPSFRGGRTLITSNPISNPKLKTGPANKSLPNSRPFLVNESQLVGSKEVPTSLSIIIPAYKASAYIEQCLDSIFSQTSISDIEVLVGIDACEDTLSTLKSIKSKYKKLKVFFSDKSAGAYVMRNSLFEMASKEAILFFDADDILVPTAFSTLFKAYRMGSPIRFKYINFDHGKNHLSSTKVHSDVAHGVFFISRELFSKMGGFQDWVCGADTEFMKRCNANKVRDLCLNIPIFYRRIHSNSLTQRSTTGYKSKVRSEIQKKIKATRHWRIPTIRKTTKLIEIK